MKPVVEDCWSRLNAKVQDCWSRLNALRAARNSLRGRMRPAGRMFVTPGIEEHAVRVILSPGSKESRTWNVIVRLLLHSDFFPKSTFTLSRFWQLCPSNQTLIELASFTAPPYDYGLHSNNRSTSTPWKISQTSTAGSGCKVRTMVWILAIIASSHTRVSLVSVV